MINFVIYFLEMKFFSFLFSKVFIRQLIFALIAVVVICYGILHWLNLTTNHGKFIQVPLLIGKTLDVVEIEIKDNNLLMVVQDSANYNPNYPKYAVIEQFPTPNTLVKENRKIYLTLNPSGYRKIGIPNIIRQTFRQAKPTLEALGFGVGTISYADDIGKDEVLSMTYKGKKVIPGMLIQKTSKIDLILGNGKSKARTP